MIEGERKKPVKIIIIKKERNKRKPKNKKRESATKKKNKKKMRLTVDKYFKIVFCWPVHGNFLITCKMAEL